MALPKKYTLEGLFAANQMAAKIVTQYYVFSDNPNTSAGKRYLISEMNKRGRGTQLDRLADKYIDLYEYVGNMLWQLRKTDIKVS